MWLMGGSLHVTIERGTVRGFWSTGIVSENSASKNGASGIHAELGSSVQRNAVHANTGFGLELATRTGYRENVIDGNTAGTVTGSGVNLGSNLCNGSTTCP